MGRQLLERQLLVLNDRNLQKLVLWTLNQISGTRSVAEINSGVPDSMSGSDRSKGIAPLEAFFCVLALLGVASIFYASGRTLGVEIGRSDVTSREHYELDKKNALQACINTVGQNAVECATKAVEAAQHNSETRQGLYAQRDSARWGFWGLMITACTTLVTTLGTALLYQQIVLTRRAVEDTDKATKAMVRQNEIAFEKERGHLSFLYGSGSEESRTITVSVKFENVGASLCEIHGVSFHFGHEEVFPTFIDPPSDGLQVKIPPQGNSFIKVQTTHIVQLPCSLHGFVVYRTAGASGLKTHFSIDLQHRADEDGRYLVSHTNDAGLPNDT